MNKTDDKKRRKRNVNYWYKEYFTRTKNLTPDEYKLVESYRLTIRKAIDIATWDCEQSDIEDLDLKKECLEIEELIFYISKILHSPPSLQYVTYGVMKFANRRKKSWFHDVIHKNNYMYIIAEDMIIHNPRKDPYESVLEETHADVGSKGHDWTYSMFGTNIYNLNQLQNLIRSQNMQMINDAIESICASGKHAHIFRRLFEKMFDGVDVTAKNAQEIGANPKKIISIKNQALNKLRAEILKNAGDDSELIRRLSIPKRQIKKENRAKKSRKSNK